MPLSYTLKDDEKLVEAALGSTTEIHLEGNPTTGYTWTREGFLGKEILSDENLEVTCKYTAAGAPHFMVGTGGTYTVLVKPKKRGRHTLNMVYVRVFDGLKPQDKRFMLHFNVM
ncbi:inhibitor of cysteine peptidase [Leishmania tarentolae]|uniref:Inhibitor of cysteine peptidase n=1 Tax=Leishmania tarentolae TaxID=5689 RepID=A0A640KJ34_LEITA|nr:inhibitor of cysteine peptidase [Leishmania tarentolae]